MLQYVLQQLVITVQQVLLQHLLMLLRRCTWLYKNVIRTWRAVDACGNTGTQTQTITYSRDLTPPTFTLGTIGAIPCNPTQARSMLQ
jgi:hypothetical protein